MCRAICLLLHRFDEEGLGIFTVSNPLNVKARDQFLNDESGFLEKAQAYTAKYATQEYHQNDLKKWWPFYPDPSVMSTDVALGEIEHYAKLVSAPC
jgi:hypothetical protein